MGWSRILPHGEHLEPPLQGHHPEKNHKYERAFDRFCTFIDEIAVPEIEGADNVVDNLNEGKTTPAERLLKENAADNNDVSTRRQDVRGELKIYGRLPKPIVGEPILIFWRDNVQ